MALFIDASALVKVYVRERRGTDVMQAILTRAEFQAGIFISDLVTLEGHVAAISASGNPD